MKSRGKSRQWRLETLALHGDPALGPIAGAEALPIHQTAAFDFETADEAAARFALEAFGPIYSRLGNPTVEAFERRMASLEGGVGALATASGQAAAFNAVATLTGQGENVVASSSVYGGIYSLFKNVFARFGIAAKFVRVDDLAGWEAAIDARTTCLYAEMIGNPLLDTPNLERLAQLAHAHGIPLIIDNTLATPSLCRPFDFGADVAVYSATKYIGGHGTTIGGVVVDSGKFDWGAGRFPQFTTPDPIYNGITFTEKFGPLAYLIQMRAHWLRDVGACMAPMTAWSLVLGIETLPLRMERHCANAAMLSEWLSHHPQVEQVAYPGRADHPTAHNAKCYLKRGSGMLGLYVKGGYEAAKQVVSRTQLFSHAANMGDCKSLIIHPASTTHSPVDPAVRQSLGIADNFLRLSVGLEHIEDLKQDLDLALAA